MLHDAAGEFDVDAFVERNVKAMKHVVSTDLITSEQYRHIVLVGNLIACITTADNRISECEVMIMQRYIREICPVDEELSHELVKVIIAMEIEDGNALAHICADLALSASHEERLKVLDVLFEVSMGDNPLDYSELNQIIHLGASLRIAQVDFEKALRSYDALVAG